MSDRLPSTTRRPGRRATNPARPAIPSDRDREAILTSAAITLGSRFPGTARSHLIDLAGDAYDGIVGQGVPIRSYLGNLVLHRARDLLHGERPRDEESGVRPSRDPRPIVIGYDGSPAADAALDRALLIGTGLSAPVRLVAAWQYPLTFGQFPLAGWDPAADIQRTIDAAVRLRFGTDIPPWFTTATIEGPAAHTLIAESRAAQMLIVGSRGHGGFVGLLLGSVSSACAEHAGCPVLVMHAPFVEHEDPVSAGAEALGDGSRASDAPAPLLAAAG